MSFSNLMRENKLMSFKTHYLFVSANFETERPGPSQCYMSSLYSFMLDGNESVNLLIH